jgi:hypothetical protein
MRLSIPDDLAEQLQTQLKGRKTIEEDVTARVRETLPLSPRLTLGIRDLEAVEGALGTHLPIRTIPQLLEACTASAQLHLGHVRLQWTPKQLEQIAERATRAGYSVEEFVARVASQLMTEIFLIQPANGPQIVIERQVLHELSPDPDADEVDA